MDKWFTAVVLSVLTLSFSVTAYAQEIDLSTLLEHHQAPVFLQSSGQTYLLGVAVEQRDGKPPLSGKRIAGEILAGALFVVPAAYSLHLVEEERVEDDRVATLLLLLGFAGLNFGPAAGVSLVGNIGDETGSYLSAFEGACCGCLAILPLFLLAIKTVAGPVADALELDENDVESCIMGVCVTLPSIGATIAFNRTRRYKTSAEPETALLNLNDGKMSLAVPRIYLRPDSSGRGNLSQSVDLLRVRF